MRTMQEQNENKQRIETIIQRCIGCNNIKGTIPKLQDGGHIKVTVQEYACKPCYERFTTIYYANQGRKFQY